MKKRRHVGIFYISLPTRREGPSWNTKGQPVLTTKRPTFPPQFAFVRCEIAKSHTLLGALDEARPRRGESVMNTHFIK